MYEEQNENRIPIKTIQSSNISLVNSFTLFANVVSPPDGAIRFFH